MSQINFPKNYDFYFKAGNQALAEQDIKTALENLLAAYQLQPDPPLNFILTSLLLEQGDYLTAWQLAEEYREYYLQQPERIELYLQLALLNHQFTLAQEILWQIQKEKRFRKLAETLQLKVDFQTEFYQQQEKQNLALLMAELRELPQKEAFLQLSEVQKIQQLTLPALKKIARELLLNPQVSLLARNFIFEKLALMGVNEDFSYLSLTGEILFLNPVTVGPPAEMLLKNKILQELNQKLAQQDPILLENLREEVQVELALLYPLQNNYADSKAWVKSFLHEYAGASDAELDLEIESLRKKIRQLMLGY